MSINKRYLEVLLTDWPGDGGYDQIGADFATVPAARGIGVPRPSGPR